MLDLRDDGLEAPDVDDAAILAQLGQEEQMVHDGNDLQELFGELGQVLHLSQRLLNENWSTVYQRY